MMEQEQVGCASSPVTPDASIPPWDRDRSRLQPIFHEPPAGYRWRNASGSKSPAKKKVKQRKNKQKNAPPNYYAYIKSAAWRAKRAKAIKHYGGKCQSCGVVENLQVHHLSYKRLGREMMSDLSVLCWNCHSIEHEEKYSQQDSQSVKFRKMFR